jgi:hypothetical protein
MKRAAIFLFLAASVAALACSKPKAGAKCDSGGQKPENGPGVCLDKTSAIVCMDGTYTQVKCEPGAVGCMNVAGSVSCTLVKDEGEPCSSADKIACSTDNKKLLECTSGKWKMKMPCKGGGKGCVSNAEGVRCENAEGNEGDPCTADQKGQGVCSPDKTKLLVCDGAKMHVATTCRGQNHCRPLSGKLDCDISMAEINDPCEEQNHLSCDTAKKTLLKCDGKKFVKVQACKQRCNNAFDKYSCD